MKSRLLTLLAVAIAFVSCVESPFPWGKHAPDCSICHQMPGGKNRVFARQSSAKRRWVVAV